MKKSKNSSSGDELSKLPDSLIFHIFWFLPISHVVRTTILSKRWRNLWTTAPFLYFSDVGLDYYKVEGALDKVGNFCNRALLLWRGAKLLKFKVRCRDKLSISLAGDINVWVRFAKEKEVRELYLDLHYPRAGYEYDNDRYLEQDIEPEFESLWSCSSLEVLSMKGCAFSIGTESVKWDRLKSLTIVDCNLTEDMLSKILCGSPKLEVFIWSQGDWEKRGNWYIQSSSLKKLSINRNSDTDRWKETEMKIQTPNLETLEISGDTYSTFSVDVGCLTGVTLGFSCLEHLTRSRKTGKSLQETLKKILPIIQQVESVTLSECCLEVLGVMNRKSPLSPLSKVKFLKLIASDHVRSFSKHLQIAGLLQILPKLERLVIEDTSDDMAESEDDNEDGYQDDHEDDNQDGYQDDLEDDNEDGYQDDRESLEFEANLPSSFLLQLRTVEVTWGKSGKSIFSFIETLLKYASKLEKMVFRVNDLMPPSSLSKSLLLASQKLLRMPRSSPTSQLIFCEY